MANPDKMAENGLMILEKVFARVPLKSPYYELLRDLQKELYTYKYRKEIANNLRSRGKTIRQIAKEMGYDHPGSVTALLNKSHDN